MNKLLPHLLSLLVFIPAVAFGQADITFNNKDEYYYRILQVSGISDDRSSFLIRPYQHNKQKISNTHPLQARLQPASDDFYVSFGGRSGLDFYEPVWFQSYNTTLPRGVNDGPLWQGKGYNTALSAGFRGQFGPLHINFRPVIGFSQNREYDLGPHEPFGDLEYTYRLQRIDYVQRFGPDTYQWANLGDSFIELRHFGLKAGFSNSKIWTGPATHNPLIFGYNAPGFLHFHISSNGPIETGIGGFEFLYLYGGLTVSDYFGDMALNNLTSVKGFTFSYSPGFANGLSFGFSRVFQERWPDSWSEFGREATKIFETFIKENLVTEESPRGADPDNQKATIFARWKYAEAGLDFYFEYGRNDHNYDLRDFRALPHHHRAYLLGFIKTFHLKNNRLLAINFEMNQHEPTRSAVILGGMGIDWHAHGGQRQGFTHRGQIITSGYGPGNNIQTVAVNIFGEKGSLGARIARINHHNGRLYRYLDQIQAANSTSDTPHDFRNTELLLGVEAAATIYGGYEISLALDQSIILNQHHIYKNDMYNARFEVMIRKNISGWLR